MKVLITGGKSSISYKILKAFENQEVLLADYGDVPAFSAGNYQLIALGARNDETTAHHLLNACLDHGAEQLLPLHEFEISAVTKSALLFEEFGIHVLLPELTDLPKYFYPQQEVARGKEWAVFQKGELIFATSAEPEIRATGKSKQLNGVFYIGLGIQDPTAVLFTIA